MVSILMKNKTIIIASCSEREAVTACLIKHGQAYDLTIELVLLDDLLNQFEIFDCVSDKGTSITWYKPDGRVITNQNNILLNRIMQVPDNLFLNFSERDQFYAQREFEAYLGFSLNAFTGFSNQSPNGLCGQFLSLPQQWNQVAGINDLIVPIYYWGLAKCNHLKSQERLVYSTIYNVLNWVVDTKKSIDTNENDPIFCFLKTPGSPVFICCIGNKTLITTTLDLDDNFLHKIQVIVKDLNDLFSFFIYEILLFIDDDDIFFGCINLEIVQSVKNPMFESFVLSSIKDALAYHVI